MFNSSTHQGNGFDHEAGLSNNAIAAQAAGMIPGSTLLKKELIQMGFKGIPQRFLTAHAPSCEYHHHGMAVAGGKYIKAVNYYDINQVIEWLQDPGTQDKIKEFKSSTPVHGAAHIGWIEFKEYKTLGAYNSTSMHVVKVLASLTDSGSQWTVRILSNYIRQRCVWQKSRYGRNDTAFSTCTWYKAGDSFRKNKEGVEMIESLTNDQLDQYLRSQKKAEAQKKRRATLLKNKLAKQAQALAQAEAEDIESCNSLLNEMEPQFIAAGADYARWSCAWYIYSKFFEGNPNKPEFMTCSRIKAWIKAKQI